MKRKICIMALAMSMALGACQNGRENQPDRPDTDKTSQVEPPFTYMTPSTISVSEGLARIGFMESAICYYLTLSRPGAMECLYQLQVAKAENVPVKVSLFDESDEISGVEPATEEVIQAYRQSQIPPIELRSRGSGKPRPVSDQIPYRVMSRIFNRIKADPNIPFYYIGDGCMARAHEMARQIKASNVTCEKLFIFSEVLGVQLDAYQQLKCFYGLFFLTSYLAV